MQPVALIAKPLRRHLRAPRTPSSCALNDNCLGDDGVARCDTCAIAVISPDTFDRQPGATIPNGARPLGDAYGGRCGTVQLVMLPDGAVGGILDGMFYPLVENPSPQAVAEIDRRKQLVCV